MTPHTHRVFYTESPPFPSKDRVKLAANHPCAEGAECREERAEAQLRLLVALAKEEGNLHVIGFPNLAHQFDRAEAFLSERGKP